MTDRPKAYDLGRAIMAGIAQNHGWDTNPQPKPTDNGEPFAAAY